MICIEMNKPEEFFWYQCTLGKIFTLINSYVKLSGKYQPVNNDEIAINSLRDIPNF
jgi:hypothetical protein